MNKYFTTFIKAGGALCASLLLTQMVSSCYDDSGLWDKIDQIEDQVADLQIARQNIEEQLKTIKSLTDGSIVIKSCEVGSKGEYLLTLSDGSSFTVWPKQQSVVTIIENGGKQYWAFYNEKGNKEYIKDADGNRIPISDQPKVIEKNGDNYIVIGGKEFPLGGHSIFSDFKMNTNEIGEITSVTFYFGEAYSFTVPVSREGKPFNFVIQMGMNKMVIDTYYVCPGQSDRIFFECDTIEGFITQNPDGWKIKDHMDSPNTGYIEAKAPKIEDITSGVADAYGVLKVQGPLTETGTLFHSELTLTTNPFSDFYVQEGEATINTNLGCQRFAYGLCKKAEYNRTTVIETATGLLDQFDYPAGYDIKDMGNYTIPLADILGTPIDISEEYVLWAAPIVFKGDLDTYEGEMVIDEAGFHELELSYWTIDFVVDESSITMSKANVDMVLNGVKSYYGGIVEDSDIAIEEILSGLEYGYYTPQTAPEYHGSAFDFCLEEEYMRLEPTPDTDYIVWMCKAKPEGSTYLAEDLIIRRFTTSGIVPGGTLVPSVTSENVTASDVNLTVAAPGAYRIYYSILRSTSASRYSDNETRTRYLFKSGEFINAEEVDVNAVDFIKNLPSATGVTLFTLAVDPDGKYGEVLVKEYTTKELIFNSISLKPELILNDPQNVQIKISATGGSPVSYVYWVGLEKDQFWTSSTKLGASLPKAEEYIYTHPDAPEITECIAKYPVAENGVITLTDFPVKTNSVLVIMAKDAQGVLSKAVKLSFIPRPIKLGTLVRSDNPSWATAKPVVEFRQDMFMKPAGMRFGEYGFNLTFKTDYTAYVMCGTEAYFSPTGEPVSVEDKLIMVVEQASKSRSHDFLVNEQEWADHNYEYPWGFELFWAPHGSATNGTATIFSETLEQHKAHCDCHTRVPANRQLELSFNDGVTPIEIRMPNAVGKGGADVVYVALCDKEGNFFETYSYPVPQEMFDNAQDL